MRADVILQSFKLVVSESDASVLAMRPSPWWYPAASSSGEIISNTTHLIFLHQDEAHQCKIGNSMVKMFVISKRMIVIFDR